MKTNLDTKGWEQRWRLGLDELIEDMESYTELPSNLSYQDELHKRLSEYGKAFIRQELSLAKQQWIEEILVKLKGMPKGCDCSYGTIGYGEIIELLDGMS